MIGVLTSLILPLLFPLFLPLCILVLPPSPLALGEDISGQLFVVLDLDGAAGSVKNNLLPSWL